MPHKAKSVAIMTASGSSRAFQNRRRAPLKIPSAPMDVKFAGCGTSRSNPTSTPAKIARAVAMTSLRAESFPDVLMIPPGLQIRRYPRREAFRVASPRDGIPCLLSLFPFAQFCHSFKIPRDAAALGIACVQENAVAQPQMLALRQAHERALLVAGDLRLLACERIGRHQAVAAHVPERRVRVLGVVE